MRSSPLAKVAFTAALVTLPVDADSIEHTVPRYHPELFLNHGLKPPVVVFSGADERVHAGLDLYMKGYTDTLLISGEYAHVSVNNLLARTGIAATRPLDGITIDYAPINTWDNARMTRDWLQQHDHHAYVLITDDIHMRRSLTLMRNVGALNGAYQMPVKVEGHFLYSLGETLKLYATWAGVPGLQRQVPYI